MSDRNYSQALSALLPPGPAWNRQRGSPGNAVIEAAASALFKVDVFVDRLIEEADPRTCRAIFEDWLRVYGLPDVCMKYLDTITDEQLRQALLLLVRRSGLTKDFYKQLGLIFDIEIDTGSYEAFRANSRADERCYGPQWAHAYVIVVRTSLTSSKIYFRANSRANERLATWGIQFLECLMRANAPAHAEVVFEYKET